MQNQHYMRLIWHWFLMNINERMSITTKLARRLSASINLGHVRAQNLLSIHGTITPNVRTRNHI